MKVSALLLASGALVAMSTGFASAGPCSDQIAELSRVTTGGAAPTSTGAISPSAPTGGGNVAGAGPAGTKPGESSEAGTGKQVADQRGGTKEMSAVAGQVATSPEDVRRQQEGRPTASQAADQASDRLPMAKAKLEQARVLDDQGKPECMNLVNEARQAMQAK
jgi:hypothetical protein